MKIDNGSKYILAIVGIVAAVGIVVLLLNESFSSDAVGLAATVDGVDDFRACDADVLALCPWLFTRDWKEEATINGYEAASWKLAFVDCAAESIEQGLASQECVDAQDRRIVLNDAMMEACRVDSMTYCPGIFPEPGHEPLVDCLLEVEPYGLLSTDCSTALDAQQGAKPLS